MLRPEIFTRATEWPSFVRPHPTKMGVFLTIFFKGGGGQNWLIIQRISGYNFEVRAVAYLGFGKGGTIASAQSASL